MKNQKFPTALITVAAVVCPLSQTAAPADTVTIIASKDNTLYESDTGTLSNGAGDYIFVGRTKQSEGESIRRGLLMFDLETAIPAGAIINSVTLSLRLSRSAQNAAHIVNVHRLLADWGEGASNAAGQEGEGAPALPGDATWLHRFYNTSFWSAPGGDFVAASSAAASVGSLSTVYNWSSAQLAADVGGWLSDPASNFGWILLGNETASESAKRFDSRTIGQESRRPRLVIDYTPVTAWANAAGGNWSIGSNWSTGAAPNGVGAEALLGPVGAQPVTVTLDVGVTLSALTIDSAYGYSLNSLSGGDILTLYASSVPSTISVVSGSHTINAPLSLAGDTSLHAAIQVAGGSMLTATSLEVTGMDIVKSGAGTFQMNADAQLVGTLHVKEGAVRLLAGPGVSNMGGISIDPGAELDLLNNSLRVAGGNLAAMNMLVIRGYEGGNWTGDGITSSVAAAEAGRALGIRQDGSDVEVAFTWAGDATVDGAVTIADLGVLAANWQQNDRYWFHGDFNFDGSVTIADLGILASNWQKGTGGAATMSIEEAMAMFDVFHGVVIPEPAHLWLLSLIGVTALRRRRNKRLHSRHT
jgi:hypothetical protein